MIRRAVGLAGDIRARILRLPPAALIAIATVAVAVVVVGGVLLYRTYDYVQHDNQFCLSCHLMSDPFERFARSEHRGLGCKACHQPTMAVRTTMALTQILEQPDELKTHAEVPNEACAECHVRGDPEKWQRISASAGHRVHLESQDPNLRGLKCVECHSSSVHEFAATDRTCAQSGCHETTEVRLGRMGALTIHCASCHDFNAPVATSAPADSLAVALRPRREECLSCHAMRLLVADFPQHDAHNAACGACHNPHEQTTPQQAVESCATAGCHSRVDTLTAFHRGLATSVVSQCTSCHTAHAFRAETSCRACHEAILTAAPVMTAQIGRPRADSVAFDHARHRNVECTACHQATTTHGQVTVTSFAQCRECHHTPPVSQNCTACHERSELTTPYRMARPVPLSVRPQPVTRQLPFDHRQHQTEQCTACHVAGPAQSAAAVSCTSCHEQHHRVQTVNCRACHTPPPSTAHTAQAHLGCAGSGCHSPLPFQGVPRTRQLCLSCHQTLVDHMPGRNCVDCHALPQPRGGAPAPAAGAAPPAHVPNGRTE